MVDRPKKGNNMRIAIKDYTVIDLETTGRNIHTCEVIEMAAVKVRDGRIIDHFSQLVKPDAPIPAIITQLTGITDEMVSNAPKCSDVLKQLLELIGDDVVVGHNIQSFDTNILYDLCEGYCLPAFSNNMIDTLHFARHCDIGPENFKLTTLTSYLNIPHPDAHRALADCIANQQCYELLKPLLMDESHEAVNGDTYEKRSKHRQKPSKATEALHELRSLIQFSLYDGILTDEEIFNIRDWMDDNKQLEGAYPYDILFEKLTEILADGIVTDDERTAIIAVMEEQLDPVSCRSEDIDIDFNGKTICLTGDFLSGPRSNVESRFTDAGAIIGKNVTSKTDYLIVGGCGSAAWSCGNYGNKVKKALELQKKGKPIKIIREDVSLKCLSMIR